MPTGTVTITQGGSVAAGSDGFVSVYTGQNATPIGVVASATNTTPNLGITPGATGSLVIGANLGVLGAYTANGSTTYKFDHAGQGLEYISMVSSATTTAATPVTIGGTAGVNSISIVLLEIKKGAGALVLDGSTPAGLTSTTTSVTSASFTPPSGSLLVLAAELNGGGGSVTAAITDTLGGLTWTEQVKQNMAGNWYAGIWTAVVPTPAPSAGMLLAGEV